MRYARGLVRAKGSVWFWLRLGRSQPYASLVLLRGLPVRGVDICMAAHCRVTLGRVGHLPRSVLCLTRLPRCSMGLPLRASRSRRAGALFAALFVTHICRGP